MENVMHKALSDLIALRHSVENRPLCGGTGGAVQIAERFDFNGVTCPACLERYAAMQLHALRQGYASLG